jgi:hypothetical protein
MNYVLKMNKITWLFCGVLIVLSSASFGQHKNKCLAETIKKAYAPNSNAYILDKEINEEKFNAFIQENKEAANKRGTIIIPTVVHVLYNQTKENISDEQIYSQIKVLNDDFSFKNTNKLDSTHPFYAYCSDAGIQFQLATKDPKGNKTNGITRTKTAKTFWLEEELQQIKFSDSSGIDGWDPNSYLNIWVANFHDTCTVLGIASFPDELKNFPAYDGLIIRHQVFGTKGTAGSGGWADNRFGRTTTHEIGHWLYLWHIWGDNTCGNDYVADTEPAESENYDCPSFPHRSKNTCGSSKHGEMYMNYMDYTTDACMNMFTKGQVERMKSAISMYRPKILTSKGYTPATTGIQQNNLAEFAIIYPNPSSGKVHIQLTEEFTTHTSISIEDILGNKVKTIQETTNPITVLHLEDLPNGIYFIRIDKEGLSASWKLILNHE